MFSASSAEKRSGVLARVRALELDGSVAGGSFDGLSDSLGGDAFHSGEDGGAIFGCDEVVLCTARTALA